MDYPRHSARASFSNVDFENLRRDSEQSSARLLTQSKSPLRSQKDNISNLVTVNYSQSDSYVSPFSKPQQTNQGHHKSRVSQTSMHTEPAINMYGKVNEIPPRKHENFKRAGSMQVANISELAKDVSYGFVAPQSLQTICNGNNAANSQGQASDKNLNSVANTISSGINSGTASTASYCKNCKRMEEQERIMTFSLNQLLNQVSDAVDKEKLWRQGTIGFELNNFSWSTDDEQGLDPKMLKKSDSGRLLLEVKKQFIQVRKGLEELMMDVENLSKTNIYANVEMQKENRIPTQSDLTAPPNPGRKLLASIAEAKQYVDSLRSAMFSEEIPPEIKDEIKNKNKKDFEEKNILRTLTLQLEQSKRERRMLEVELNLQRKGMLQNPNGVNQASLRQMIRQIVDEEIKANNAEEFGK